MKLTVPDFLSQIIAATREELNARKKKRPLDEIKKVISGSRRTGSFSRALSLPGISLIAEIKRASPSKGMIRPGLDVASVTASYESAGARAVSILTEARYFRGSLDDLRMARSSCSLPLLRKDFIIDPYQVWEAKEAGADAVLLIVAALREDELADLAREAKSAGLETLVEVHSHSELERALSLDAGVVGINNRDLKSFEVDLETSLKLRADIPENVLTVAESGIKDRSDVARLAAAGFNAILVGEVLMRSEDPGRKIKEMITF